MRACAAHAGAHMVYDRFLARYDLFPRRRRRRPLSSLARTLIERPAKKLTKDALPMAHTLLVVRMNND